MSLNIGVVAVEFGREQTFAVFNISPAFAIQRLLASVA
jgi:hypothetical protein